jgi:hypothetical protein
MILNLPLLYFRDIFVSILDYFIFFDVVNGLQPPFKSKGNVIRRNTGPVFALGIEIKALFVDNILP